MWWLERPAASSRVPLIRPFLTPLRMETHCLAGHVGLELRNVDANYPFERLHRFAGIQPNSGFGDYSRLSCGVGDTQLGPRPGSRRGCLLARATPAELARIPRIRAEFRPGRPLV